MSYPRERRRRARLKLPPVVRVRPSDADLNFDGILPTLNATRESVYFASKPVEYFRGHGRVDYLPPYSDAPDSLNRESLGRVVRIAGLGQGRRGIAMEILMPSRPAAKKLGAEAPAPGPTAIGKQGALLDAEDRCR